MTTFLAGRADLVDPGPVIADQRSVVLTVSVQAYDIAEVRRPVFEKEAE